MANGNPALTALGALGDPTRRLIFERLVERPWAVGDLASRLPVSRPAVSQHLRVLKSVGLVTETAEGARRVYRIDPRGIGTMRDWLDSFWADRLESFKSFADSQEDDQP
jgi:DNA-binding transcriptional ArsR family regulator